MSIEEEKEELQFLLPPLDKIIESWIEEDIPSFDFGAFVVGNKETSAVLKSILIH
jgi:nicotinate-nucleotide pyrophosphorylase (carboxylating)